VQETLVAISDNLDHSVQDSKHGIVQVPIKRAVAGRKSIDYFTSVTVLYLFRAVPFQVMGGGTDHFLTPPKFF
jgi:hypothetical protein